MKLILVPAAILLLIGVLSICGLGGHSGDYGDNMSLYNGINPDGTAAVLYDSGGNPVCYYNGTEVAGQGAGKFVEIPYGEVAGWVNASYTNAYPLFYDAAATTAVPWANALNPSGMGYNGMGSNTFNLGSSLGWLVVIGVIMGIGALVGIKIFGSGESEISVDLLLKGTFFLTIWGVLTAMAYALILDGGFPLYLIYFALSLTYTIGIVNSVGSPQGND